MIHCAWHQLQECTSAARKYGQLLAPHQCPAATTLVCCTALHCDVLCCAASVCVVQFKGVMMLDWPLVAIMSLTNDGSYPHMALQARRSMPAGDKEALYWYGEWPAEGRPVAYRGSCPGGFLTNRRDVSMRRALQYIVTVCCGTHALLLGRQQCRP